MSFFSKETKPKVFVLKNKALLKRFTYILRQCILIFHCELYIVNEYNVYLSIYISELFVYLY